MELLVIWIITALSVMVGAYLIPGVTVNSFMSALVVAIVLGLFNLTLKPILKLVTLPINILTLGLFTLVINALLVWLAAEVLEGFSISGFWPAFFFAIVISVLVSIFAGRG